MKILRLSFLLFLVQLSPMFGQSSVSLRPLGCNDLNIEYDNKEDKSAAIILESKGANNVFTKYAFFRAPKDRSNHIFSQLENGVYRAVVIMDQIEPKENIALWSPDKFISSEITVNCASGRSSSNEWATSMYESKVSIFPNPTAGEINIAFSEEPASWSFRMFNTLGKEVLNNSNKKIISTQGLSSGIYLIEINSIDGFKHAQLISILK